MVATLTVSESYVMPSWCVIICGLISDWGTLTHFTDIKTLAEQNHWRLVHKKRFDRDQISVGWQNDSIGLLVLMFSEAPERRLTSVTAFDQHAPTGETMLAGDRLNYVHRKLGGER